MPLIRSGRGRTFLRWVRTLPDERVVEHPELAVAAAMSSVLVGQGTIAPRRWLRLAERAHEGARGARPVRRWLGKRGPRADDRPWRRAGGGRSPQCGGARAGRVGRDLHGGAGRLFPGPLPRRRPGRGLRHGDALPRASGCRETGTEPGVGARDAGPRRGRARAARIRARPRREGEGRRGPGGHPPELARRACVHRARPRAGRRKGSSRRRSASSPSPSISPGTRWRRCITRGCSS